MDRQNITWNGLYATKQRKRHYAELRILNHFRRMRLENRGVKKAAVRY